MPVYDYRCENGHTWEEYRALGDHATTCPQCGASGRHVFVPVRFKFSLAKRGRPLRREPTDEGEMYSRTYRSGERIGDPMLDGGFERVR